MGRSATSVSADAETTVLELPAELGIEYAAGLKALLLPAASLPGALQLDGGQVARLHAAAMQLLTTLCRDRRDAGLPTSWTQVSVALREAAAALGLADLLNLPTEQR